VPESQERLEQYNTSLWTYTPLGFLPHGYNGDPTEHPIWLSLKTANSNNASIIVFPDGNPNEIETSETLSQPNDYKKKIIIFDANSPAQMTNTIKCIKANLDESTKLWQQDSKGKWQLGEANKLVN
jgi:DNA polymerase IIIc chi subunit